MAWVHLSQQLVDEEWSKFASAIQDEVRKEFGIKENCGSGF